MTLKEIYEESVKLSDMMKVLEASIYHHNPVIRSDDKIPLPLLAIDCKTLAVKLGNLGSDILNVHMEQMK